MGRPCDQDLQEVSGNSAERPTLRVKYVAVGGAVVPVPPTAAPQVCDVLAITCGARQRGCRQTGPPDEGGSTLRSVVVAHRNPLAP